MELKSASQKNRGTLDLDRFLPFELAVVANRISRMVGRIFDERYGLQIPEWRILVTLDRHGDLTPNDIVEKTSMDKARVSRAQRRLADLDLVTIVDDPDDGRRKVLRLSEKGTEICTEIVPDAIEREQWLLESLSAAEQVALTSILEKLHSRTEQME